LQLPRGDAPEHSDRLRVRRNHGPEGTVTLFTEALNVINAALEKHRKSAPYGQILAASQKLLGDRKLGVAV